MDPYRTPGVRPPMDTQSEFEPCEIATGEALDAYATGYGVSRLENEDDQAFRQRIYEAMQVSRASTRVARGESLMPPVLADRVALETRKAALLAELAEVDRSLFALDYTLSVGFDPALGTDTTAEVVFETRPDGTRVILSVDTKDK